MSRLIDLQRAQLEQLITAELQKTLTERKILIVGNSEYLHRVKPLLEQYGARVVLIHRQVGAKDNGGIISLLNADTHDVIITDHLSYASVHEPSMDKAVEVIILAPQEYSHSGGRAVSTKGFNASVIHAHEEAFNALNLGSIPRVVSDRIVTRDRSRKMRKDIAAMQPPMAHWTR